MTPGYRTKRFLHDCGAPPAPRRYIGEVDSAELQARAMAHYPEPNADGRLVMAEKWQEAVRWLRTHAKRGWRLDSPITKEKP
jgi:hypothetical protein